MISHVTSAWQLRDHCMDHLTTRELPGISIFKATNSYFYIANAALSAKTAFQKIAKALNSHLQKIFNLFSCQNV